jgi:hypothetical protein
LEDVDLDLPLVLPAMVVDHRQPEDAAVFRCPRQDSIAAGREAKQLLLDESAFEHVLTGHADARRGG